MKAYIKQIESISGNQAVALMQVVHGPGESIADNYGAAVSESTDREYMVVPGSSVEINSGRTQTFVRSVLTRMQDVKDVAEIGQMRSVSKNMYMDKSDRLWTLRKSESGEQVLVRNQDISDNDDLLEMLRSVSSATPAQLASQNPELSRMLNAYQADLSGAQGGDMISYVSESGDLRVGFVAAQVTDDNSFLVVDKNGVEEQISSLSMVAVLDGNELDEKQFPQIDSLSAAGGVDVDKLLAYYAQVFRYSPEYYEKMADIIRNHSF